MQLVQAIQDYITTGQGDFNLLALQVFSYQYHHCEPYQRYCQQLGKTPDTVKTWQQVPAVSTEIFREFTLCTLPIAEAKYIFQTSGTSQETKGKHYYHDMTLYDAAIKNSFMSSLGLAEQPKPIFRVLTPSFADVSTSSLFYMFQQVIEWYGDARSQFYFHQNELDVEKLTHDLQEDIAEDRAVVLLGTAFSYVNFCDYLQDHQIILPLPKGSRLLETGGLKGRTRTVSRSELYDLFRTLFGLDLSHCFSEYGMTELSSQCYSQPNSHIFHFPRWMPTRIIDPETGDEVPVGKTGLVQFFDLANYSAVSAVVTSDLAIRHQNSFELIGRAPKAILRGCSTAFES
jgi:hypothetical protein